MAKSKKMLGGAGWSFEPADSVPEQETLSLPPEKQQVKIAVEKRPKGKVATVVRGFVLSGADRKTLAANLKKSCGSGGTDSGESIEIQGDHADTVRAFLSGKGWRVR